MSLYMVIENFKNGDAAPVYRRFRDRGRLAPEGLSYISSWVNDQLDRCYQLMETEDRALLDRWIANWSDLVDFEVHPVITSKEAAEKIGPRLEVVNEPTTIPSPAASEPNLDPAATAAAKSPAGKPSAAKSRAAGT